MEETGDTMWSMPSEQGDMAGAPTQETRGGAANGNIGSPASGFSMANPSLKNGYLSIATELVEALAKHRVAGNDMQIIWCVWRKTWGWKDGDRKKDWDWIALSQFRKMTGLHQATVVRSLKSLVAKKLLLKGNNGYKFNQNHDEWVVAKVLHSSKNTTRASSKSATEISSKSATNNRNKERRKERRSGASPAEGVSPKYTPLGAEVVKAFSFNHASPKWYNNTIQRAACDRLIETHGLDRVLRVVAILPKTNTMQYVPTITTPLQLEDKWSSFESAMLKKKAEQTEKLSKNKVAFR